MPDSAQELLAALDAQLAAAPTPAQAANIQAQREQVVMAMQGLGDPGTGAHLPAPSVQGPSLLQSPADAAPGALAPVSFGADAAPMTPLADTGAMSSSADELPAPGPTLGEVQRMRMTPSPTATHGSGANVAGAAKAYGAAQGGVDAAVAQQQATLQAGVAEAHARGEQMGAQQAGAEKAYGEDAVKAQALAAERDAAQAKQIADRQKIVDDVTAAKAAPLPKMDSSFLAALAVGLGAFGASVNHGPNTALVILNGKLDQEMATRAARIDSLKGQLDSIDKAGAAVMQRFDSREGALQTMREIRLKQAQQQTDAWSRLDSNSQKARGYQMMSDQLGTLAAEAKANAAAAVLQASQKASKGNGRTVYDDYKDTLALSKEGASIAKTLDGIGEGGKSAVDDAFNKLPAGIQNSVLNANKLRGTLGSLLERAETMQKAGKDVLPGSENLLNDLGDFAARKFREATGPSGTNGLTDEQSSFRADLQAMGRAKYLMEAGNAANQEGERKAAEEAVSGNLRMSNIISNIKRAQKSAENTTRQAYAQMTPALVKEVERRRRANLGPNGDGYREGAAPSPGASVPGARRAGE